MVSRDPILIGITGRPIAAGKVGAAAAVGVGVGYLAAVERAGGTPVVISPRELDADAARELLSRFDGLLLLGGSDVDPSLYSGRAHPAITGTDIADDRFEIALTRAAIDDDVPLLAVCRGIQVLNVARGGTLVAHLPETAGVGLHGRPGVPNGAAFNEVTLDAGSLLAKTMGADRVRCSCHHHQALDRLGDAMRVTARADDGVVEGAEVEGAWALAVQWHPEDTAGDDPAQQRLFDALVAEARTRR
jgi:gamma-glutamyl-gamma-aminobutyrate hydrolase PuuD